MFSSITGSRFSDHRFNMVHRLDEIFNLQFLIIKHSKISKFRIQFYCINEAFYFRGIETTPDSDRISHT